MAITLMPITYQFPALIYFKATTISFSFDCVGVTSVIKPFKPKQLKHLNNIIVFLLGV